MSDVPPEKDHNKRLGSAHLCDIQEEILLRAKWRPMDDPVGAAEAACLRVVAALIGVVTDGEAAKASSSNGVWGVVLRAVCTAFGAADGVVVEADVLGDKANPVAESMDAEDRQTAQDWVKRYEALLSAQWAKLGDSMGMEAKVSAMLPLVRLARDGAAQATLVRAGMGWKVVGEVIDALGMPKDSEPGSVVERVKKVRRSAETWGWGWEHFDSVRGALDVPGAKIGEVLAEIEKLQRERVVGVELTDRRALAEALRVKARGRESAVDVGMPIGLVRVANADVALLEATLLEATATALTTEMGETQWRRFCGALASKLSTALFGDHEATPDYWKVCDGVDVETARSARADLEFARRFLTDALKQHGEQPHTNIAELLLQAAELMQPKRLPWEEGKTVEVGPEQESCVVVLVTNGSGQVCLILSKKPGRMWELPGGKRRRGETPQAAAVREIQEETGLVLDPSALTSLGVLHGDPKPGADFTSKIYVFSAQLSGRPLLLPGDDAEVVRWWWRWEVLETLQTGELSDLSSRDVLLKWAATDKGAAPMEAPPSPSIPAKVSDPARTAMPATAAFVERLPVNWQSAAWEAVELGRQEAVTHPNCLVAVLEDGAQREAVASAMGQLRGVVTVRPGIVEVDP